MDQSKGSTAAPSAAPTPGPLASPQPWDLVADAYTSELLPMFEAFAEDALRLAKVPRDGYVVDVAAGPGTLAILAARAGMRAEALDFSEQMVENLRKRLAAEALSGVNVQTGDGQQLPYADESFDGAFSLFGLMFFPDRARGFRELRRVLKPGARAVVSSWAPMEGVLALMFEGVREALPELGLTKTKPPLGDAAEFEAELKAAGFREAEVHTVAHEPPAELLADFWATAQRTTAPIVLLRRKVGEERWAEVAKSVYAKMEAALGPGKVTIEGKAHLGVGLK